MCGTHFGRVLKLAVFLKCVFFQGMLLWLLLLLVRESFALFLINLFFLRLLLHYSAIVVFLFMCGTHFGRVLKLAVFLKCVFFQGMLLWLLLLLVRESFALFLINLFFLRLLLHYSAIVVFSFMCGTHSGRALKFAVFSKRVVLLKMCCNRRYFCGVSFFVVFQTLYLLPCALLVSFTASSEFVRRRYHLISTSIRFYA